MTRPRLSLCVIARNNEAIIEQCLTSIKPWVDEMVVVDTGSTDKTPRIAESLGAKLGYFQWCDDFSAARNKSIELATGEWLFWMDTDDTIPQSCGARLRELADGEHPPNVGAYVMQTHCLGRCADELTTVDHVKLFRNHPQIRFEFRIHEQLLPSIRGLGAEVVWTDIYVEHHGSNLEAEAKQAKYERDMRILGKEIEERPEHPFALFNLGMTYSDMQEHEQAVEYLERSLAVSSEGDSHTPKACALLLGSLCALEQWERALDLSNEWMEKYGDDIELRFRRAIILHELKRHDESEQLYREVLTGETDRKLSSIDPGIRGNKSRHNLAIVLNETGRASEAEVQFRRAVRDAPTYLPTRRALVEHLFKTGRLRAADMEIHAMGRMAPEDIGPQVLRCELLARRGEVDEARTAYARLPQGEESVADSYARFLFEHGPNDEAIEYLQAMLEAYPEKRASTLHNLGAVYARQGNHDEAIRCFGESLELRPESKETQAQLEAIVNATKTVVEDETS